MKFAVIADDASFTRLPGMIGQWQGELVAVSGPGFREQIPVGASLWSGQPADLLEKIEAVLVAGNSPALTGGVPALARQSVPVWLIPESCLGSDFIYAQIPLDEEFPDTLQAVWPLRQSPAVVELQRRLTTGELGAVLHLQMERAGAGGSSFSAATAEGAWLHDADLLRTLSGGDYRRVTAIHSGLSSQGITTASVGLSGEGVPDAMWAFRGGATSRAELTITTERGAAVLLWEADSAPTLTVNCHPVELPHAGNTPPDIPRENSPPLPIGVTPWNDAVRAFDLLDAARRSLVRRRTVELQFESTSERSQFKTHMTTVGCGLLLYTMFGLIGLLFVGRMFDPRDTQQKQSEVAGFVLTVDHFSHSKETGEATELNSLGRQVVAGIIENYQRRSATILIEGTPEPSSGTVPNQRRAAIVRELTSSKLKDAEVRTLVRPLAGRWFKRGMVLAWVVLFLPLGIFLAIQILIGVTPAGADESHRSRT